MERPRLFLGDPPGIECLLIGHENSLFHRRVFFALEPAIASRQAEAEESGRPGSRAAPGIAVARSLFRRQNAAVAFLGMTPRRWIEYSAAILAGNAIYFLVLYPDLAPPLRHQPFRFDVGLALDFLCCVVVYGVIRLGVNQARRMNQRAGGR